MKSSTKRMLSILSSAVLFVASLVVWSYLIQPAYEYVKNLRAEGASRSKLIGEYEDSLKRVAELQNQYQNIIQIQENVGLILPDRQNLPQAVNQITGLANVNNLIVDSLAAERLSIKPSVAPNIAKGIGTLRINARLTGEYQSFRAFLGNLETNANIFDLESAKIEGTTIKSKSGEPRFFYAITADTYYQSD